MKRFTLINDGGLADIATVAEFAGVDQARIRQMARRQWAKGSPVSIAVACDRVSHRLLYAAGDVVREVETTRERKMSA